MNKVATKQVEALKYLIRNLSEDAYVTKIACTLVDASQNLSRPVCLTLIEEDRKSQGAVKLTEAAYKFHIPHIRKAFAFAGIEMVFSVHFGYYDKKGKFNTNTGTSSKLASPPLSGEEAYTGLRYTFWLSSTSYDHQAYRLKTSVKGVRNIRITKQHIKNR